MKSIVDRLNEINESMSVGSSVYVDEGFKDVWNKVKNKFKLFFTKIKDWVVCTFSDGKAVPAISPVNTGIAIDKGYASDGTCIAAGPMKASFNKYGVKSSTDKDIIDTWKRTKKNVFEGKVGCDWRNMITEAAGELSLSGEGLYGPDVNTDELTFYLKAAIKHPGKGAPLLIWGAPGIGKTAIVRAVCKQYYGKDTLITKNLAQIHADEFSLPAFDKDDRGKITGSTEIPKTWLPMYRVTGDPEVDAISDNIANGGTKDGEEGKGGVIFFDEIARCTTDVQAVALTLIQDRELVGYKLGSKWAIVAASNRECDDPNTDITLSKALGNRFGQVNFVPAMDSWLEWANKKGYMNQDVLTFLKFNQQYWYLCHPEDDNEKVFASPRAWELCCQALCNIADGSEEDGFSLDDIPSSLIRKTLLQYVQPNVATEFMTYYDLMRAIDIDALNNVFDDPKRAPSLLKDKGGKALRTDIKYYMVNKALSGIDPHNTNTPVDKYPSTEAMDNFATWLITGKDESLAASSLNILYKMYPKFKYMLGNPEMKDIKTYKDTWDRYASMVDILSKGLPGINIDYDDVTDALK